MIYGLGMALGALAAIVTLQFTYGGPPIFKGASVPLPLVALAFFGIALFIFAYRRMKKHVTRSWGEVRLWGEGFLFGLGAFLGWTSLLYILLINLDRISG